MSFHQPEGSGRLISSLSKQWSHYGGERARPDRGRKTGQGRGGELGTGEDSNTGTKAVGCKGQTTQEELNQRLVCGLTCNSLWTKPWNDKLFILRDARLTNYSWFIKSVCINKSEKIKRRLLTRPSLQSLSDPRRHLTKITTQYSSVCVWELPCQKA